MSAIGGPNVTDNGLVLSLDAGNTLSYPGSGTTWEDLSGNSNNGTLTNGPTFNSNIGGSLVFDGVNDYVNLGTPQVLRIEQEVALSAWINIQAISSDSGYRAIIGNDETNRNYNFYVKGNGNGTWNLHLSNAYNGNTTPFIGTLSDAVLGRNVWYNVVGKISAVIDKQEYYVNGSLLNSFDVTGFSSMTAISAQYRIGASDNYFNGNISNVQIYNRALSAQEILQNYNATKGRFGL